jgi:hypothetical protein
MILARWGGLKGIEKILRPYQSTKIKVVYTTFINLIYTTTPLPTPTFQPQIPFPNFFFRAKVAYLWLTNKVSNKSSNNCFNKY